MALALPAVAGAVGGARLMLQLRHHARQPAAQAAGLNLSLIAAFLAAYQVRRWLGGLPHPLLRLLLCDATCGRMALHFVMSLSERLARPVLVCP